MYLVGGVWKGVGVAAVVMATSIGDLLGVDFPCSGIRSDVYWSYRRGKDVRVRPC